jgi:FdhD protein
MSSNSVETEWYEYKKGWERKSDEVIGEAMVAIYVNGIEIATIMCTPQEQDLLALGFLWNEGFIAKLAEVDHVHIGADGCCVDVWLNHSIQQPERKIFTTGCGRGVTFTDPFSDIEPLSESVHISPETLEQLFNHLHLPDSLHARAHGVHTAGLVKGDQLLYVAEDIGRHNTIDKLMGACLVSGVETRGFVLLATGRISSEMLRKAAAMGCPIIASRNSPTSLSVEMADAAGITLVGYARRGRLRAYTHPHRLGFEES